MLVLGHYPLTFYDAIGVGGETAAYYNSPLAVLHSPPFLPYEFSAVASLTNPFGIEGFYAGNFAIAMRGKGLAFEGVRAGGYQRITFAFGMSRWIGSANVVGATLRLVNEIAADENLFSFDLDMGLGFDYGDTQIGIMSYSIFGHGEQALSAFIHAVYGRISTGAEVAMSVGNKMFVRGTVSYSLSKNLRLSIGKSTDPEFWGAGVTIMAPMRVDYAYRQHKELGGTHLISVTMNPGR